MKRVPEIISWIILLIPFALLFCFYDSLANEVLIARSFFGNEVVTAPKSFFTVFRAPSIEIVCAAVIEMMRRKSASLESENPTDYHLFWSILMYTVAFKSLLQALEIISSDNKPNILYYLTLGIVIAGIILALFKIRKVFSKLFHSNGKFSFLESGILIFLLFAYLGLAIVPTFVFK